MAGAGKKCARKNRLNGVLMSCILGNDWRLCHMVHAYKHLVQTQSHTSLALGCVKSNLPKSLFCRHGAEDANTVDYCSHMHIRARMQACTLTRIQMFERGIHTCPHRCTHRGVTLVDLSVEVCSTVAAFLIS